MSSIRHHKDHVVELQLITHAINQIKISNILVVYLANFFNQKDNIKITTKDDNKRKREAVKKFIEKITLSSAEKDHINTVYKKWTDLKSNLSNQPFDIFYDSMNKIFKKN